MGLIFMFQSACHSYIYSDFPVLPGQPQSPYIRTRKHRHLQPTWSASLQIRPLSSFPFSCSHSHVPLPLWFTSQPTYLELRVYFGISVPAKNQLKWWNTSEAGDPSEIRGGSDPSVASQRASVGFSVNNCPILFHCHLNQTLKPFHGAFIRRFISKDFFFGASVIAG